MRCSIIIIFLFIAHHGLAQFAVDNSRYSRSIVRIIKSRQAKYARAQKEVIREENLMYGTMVAFSGLHRPLLLKGGRLTRFESVEARVFLETGYRTLADTARDMGLDIPADIYLSPVYSNDFAAYTIPMEDISDQQGWLIEVNQGIEFFAENFSMMLGAIQPVTETRENGTLTIAIKSLVRDSIDSKIRNHAGLQYYYNQFLLNTYFNEPIYLSESILNSSSASIITSLGDGFAIGHELGHVIMRHKGSLNLTTARRDPCKSRQHGGLPNEISIKAKKMEFEADSVGFLVYLQAKKHALGVGLIFGFMHTIDVINNICNAPTQTSHPPAIERAARIQRQAKNIDGGSVAENFDNEFTVFRILGDRFAKFYESYESMTSPTLQVFWSKFKDRQNAMTLHDSEVAKKTGITLERLITLQKEKLKPTRSEFNALLYALNMGMSDWH